jgi:KDO2-lipid IV(A) lauroyltransferase
MTAPAPAAPARPPLPPLPEWRPHESWWLIAPATRWRRTLRAWAIVAAATLAGLLPFDAACALGRALGSLAWRLSRGLRRTVLANLALAFPDRDDAWRERTGRASLRHLGQLLLETAQDRHLDRHIGELVELPPESARALDEGLAQGRGVVAATGHIGSWEVIARRVTHAGFPLAVVAREQNAPALTRWVDRSRRRAGMGIVWRRPRQRVADRLQALLRGNAVVALLCDQDASVRKVFVPFFGRPAATPRGPGELVLATGARLVAGWSHRLPGNRHRITIEAVETPPSTGDPERDVAALVALATGRLERAVREAPEEWIWFHHRWRTRPPDETAAAPTRRPAETS